VKSRRPDPYRVLTGMGTMRLELVRPSPPRPSASVPAQAPLSGHALEKAVDGIADLLCARTAVKRRSMLGARNDEELAARALRGPVEAPSVFREVCILRCRSEAKRLTK
jgi:hypothetical protein